MKAVLVSSLALLLVAGVVMASRFDHVDNYAYDTEDVVNADTETSDDAVVDDADTDADVDAEYAVEPTDEYGVQPFYMTHSQMEDAEMLARTGHTQADRHIDYDAPGYAWPAPDSDRDGVFDRLDRCPMTKANVDVDACGCELGEENEKAARAIAAYPIGVNSHMRDQVLRRGFIAIDRAFFDTNHWNIRPDAEEALRDVAEVINSYPTLKFAIEGHADSRGEQGYNEELSDRRAEEVERFLVEECDVRPMQLVARGYGETRLATPEDSGIELQANRRVDFRVVNPEAMPRASRFQNTTPMQTLYAQEARSARSSSGQLANR